jgi:hypothetical protein
VSKVDVDRVIRRWPTRGARDWLLAFLDRAARDPNVRAVVAVGSAVRSDVPSGALDIVARCLVRRRLNERAPNEVDLRSFDIDHVEAGLERGEDLLTWSVRFGRPLLDRDGTWQRIVDRWGDRIPLPDPDVARDRAASARRRLDEMVRVGDEDVTIDLRVSLLTHLARAVLAEAGVYPASRPELSGQLRQVGDSELADELEAALTRRAEQRTADIVA